MITFDYKEFTRETLGDALVVAGECFHNGADAQVRKALLNPVLREGFTAGEIAYQDGVPVCFQAVYPKVMYIGNTKLFGHTAGCLGLRKGFSGGYLLGVLDRSISGRKKCKIYFGNTACRVAAQMNVMRGAKYGPDTYNYEAFGIVNKSRAAFYILKRKLLHCDVMVHGRSIEWFDYSDYAGGMRIQRLKNFKDNRIDDFWGQYLSCNKGLVSSRTSEELEWAFGEKMSSGRTVALALVSGEVIKGFIVIAPSESYGVDRWDIMDMIALENDENYLVMLLNGAIKFLRKRTVCYMLSVRGFPPWIHELFAFFFKRRQMYNCNKAVYKILDNNVETLLHSDLFGHQNWFWGPFDGDYSYN